MANMNPERWQLIDELFHAAMDLPAEQRSNFFRNACAGDPALQAEIENLIDGYERAENFIETPPALDDITLAPAEPAKESLIGFRFGA